jgi:hypothetical protein
MRCGTLIRYSSYLEVVSIAAGVQILGESSFCDSTVRVVQSVLNRCEVHIAFLGVNALKVLYFHAIRSFAELNHLHLLGLR